MGAKRDRNLLIEVVRMHFIQKLDQKSIASKLGYSPSTVSRMISEAVQRELITFQIVGEETNLRNLHLEQDLRKKFPGIVFKVAVSPRQGDALPAVVSVAAEVFEDLARHVKRIGFGWGSTMQKLIETIPSVEIGVNHYLTPLLGGMPLVDTAQSGNNMIVSLAEKSGTVAERFDAPAVVESSITWEALMGESSVQAAISRAASSDLAFVGIGNFGLATSELVIDAMKLSEEDYADFRSKKPVGDLCGYYYDISGKQIDSPVSQRIIGLNLEHLKNISTTVGVVSGKNRLQGLLGAISSGCLDIICLDDKLALQLLNETPEAKTNATKDEPQDKCPNCGFAA